MEEAKINTMEVHQRSQPREQSSAAPRGEQADNNNPNFPPRRQQHAHFDMKGTIGDTLPPHSLHQHSTIPWPVMLLVDQ